MSFNARTLHNLFGRGQFNMDEGRSFQPFTNVSEDDPFSEADRRLLILFASRCGSSYLCRVLRGTGLMGDPSELLNPNALQQVAARYSTSTMNDTLRALVKSYSTANGTFIAKSSPRNLALLYAIGEFPANLGRWNFMLLTREDLVGQAISIVKMNLSGQRHSIHDAEKELTQDDYDFDAIVTQLNAIKNSNISSEMFFKSQVIEYYHLTYERFIENIPNAIKDIGKKIGVDIPDSAIQPDQDLKQMRDDLTDHWRARFFEDMRTNIAMIAADPEL